MRFILKTILILAILFFSTYNYSAEYHNHKSLVLKTIPLQYELALKVIPVIRTYISAKGHVAHIKGSHQIVVLANLETQQVLLELLSPLKPASFNANELKIQLEKRLLGKTRGALTSEVIKLKYVNANVLVAALSALISPEGQITVLADNQVKVTDQASYTSDIAKLVTQLDSSS